MWIRFKYDKNPRQNPNQQNYEFRTINRIIYQ